MELDSEDIARFGNAINRFERVLDGISDKNSSVGTSNVTINAGGVGVVILLSIATFVLGLASFSAYSSSSRMNDMERRQDRQDDYIQAIYSIAPQLKPKESK
jgi:hypothetical protein